MSGEASQLEILFLPYMAHGHMIPFADMARLFAGRGVKSTIITTPLNAPFFSSSIQRSKNSGLNIDLKIIEFPSREAGLPEGCENIDYITSNYKEPDMVYKFFMAMSLFKDPIEKIIQECKPDCLVADLFFTWATESAAKFAVPRLVFHGSGFFPSCVDECLRKYEPHKNVLSDDEPFLVPNIPGEIELTRNQLADSMRQNEENETKRFIMEIVESQTNSYGMVFNSFYELEPAYADYYRNVLKRKAWHVGPVSLCNTEIEEKAARGMQSSIDHHECLKWLDSKKPSSVIYICFGSIANFTDAQLREIAKGLEASGLEFIWVVRKGKKLDREEKEEWLPDGFEERTKEKGLIIRGWAPQVLLLEHQAIGGFVTHCGWNSILEGVSAGMPMVTWPVSAEQFYNEKLVAQILEIGISIGVQKWTRVVGDFVTSEKVEKAVREIMVGPEAMNKRSRAKELAEMARRAVENGGSSYTDLNALIEELSSHRRGS